MKNALAIILAALLLTSAAGAEKLVAYVTDDAKLLTNDQQRSLTAAIERVRQNTTIELAIVTVHDTSGEPLASYATRIGEENGVGNAEADNGVVIVWSETNVRGGFIATGRGVGDVLTDAELSRLGRLARPLFNKNKTYEGLQVIVSGAQDLIEKKHYQATVPASEPLPLWMTMLLIAAAALGILFFLAVISDSGGGSGRSGGSRGGGGSWSGGSYASMGSFSSGGGGFGGFGGGSFGGGGAGF